MPRLPGTSPEEVRSLHGAGLPFSSDKTTCTHRGNRKQTVQRLWADPHGGTECGCYALVQGTT